jgi:hypothetical protein
MEPLAPPSGISGAPLPKNGSFLDHLASTNKCLAQSNKSRTGGKATKSGSIIGSRLIPPNNGPLEESDVRNQFYQNAEYDCLWLR